MNKIYLVASWGKKNDGANGIDTMYLVSANLF